MKKSIKVALAIIMALVFSITCATVAVFAASDETNASAGKVCRIGAEGTGTYYDSLSAAIAAANTDDDHDTITVIANTSAGASSLTITKPLTITSENEYTVSCSVSNAFKIDTGSANAIDGTSDVIFSGKLTFTTTTNQIVDMTSGDVEITDSVSMTGTQDVVNAGGRMSSSSHKASIKISGDAKITGTEKTSEKGALFLAGSGTTKLIITGGTISATNKSHAVRFQSKNSTIEISGGTLNGGASGNAINFLDADNSTITIDEGTFTGYRAIYSKDSSNSTITINDGTLSANTETVTFAGSSGGKLTINGGTISANTGNQAIYYYSSNALDIDITDGDIEVKTDEKGHALYLAGTSSNKSTVNISGGTIKAYGADQGGTRVRATVCVSGSADYKIDITGGTIIARHSLAIAKESGKTATATINISGGEIYAGKQAIVAADGLTFNISGGLIDVSNTWSEPTDKSGQYAIVTNKGSVNITGGKFILGGTNDSAMILYHEASNETGVTTVNGGLFINNNKVNKRLFGPGVKYESGRILYGKNIDIVITGTEAPKTVKVAYGTADNVYYLYTRFAATDENKAGTMVDGAQIRLTKGTTGMRFTTTFDEIDGATYGTIIVPASYLANLNSFTLEALDAAGLTYLNIEAINGIDIVDGKVTIRAAITNIELNNYTTAFAAIAYAKVGDTYYYTAFDLADHARTVDYVATEALDDLRETKEGDYQNKVTAYGVTLYSPYTATQREILEGFVSVTLNVPRPTDATLVNCGDGSYMYYVANASSSTHTSYAASLVSAGFTQTATNDLEGNIYTTYTKGAQIVTVAYTPNTKELRVIMESAANTSLPSDEEYVAPASPVATTLTQIGQLYDNPATEDVDESTAIESKNGNNYITSYTSGMGYVIRLEDGSFIIVDGGYNTQTHAANIYNTLVKQNGSEDNIVIAAWIFTHAHDDHVGAFKAFTEDYANKVTVERFIYNFPAKEATKFADDDNPPDYTAIRNAINKYDGAVTTIAHAGQVFDIANSKVNILYTYELMQPNKELDYYNGCSVVFNVVVEGKTILFLGDAGGDSANPLNTKDRELTYIKKIYTSETLKADIVQAAHHGIDDLGGVFEVEFYGLVDADILLIPVADRYVKIDDSYVDVYDRAACTQSGDDATKYIAGATVTVLTLDNGSVSDSVFDNVDAYTNS